MIKKATASRRRVLIEVLRENKRKSEDRNEESKDMKGVRRKYFKMRSDSPQPNGNRRVIVNIYSNLNPLEVEGKTPNAFLCTEYKDQSQALCSHALPNEKNACV